MSNRLDPDQVQCFVGSDLGQTVYKSYQLKYISWGQGPVEFERISFGPSKL